MEPVASTLDDDEICKACRRLEIGKALRLIAGRMTLEPKSGGLLLDEHTERFIPPLQTRCALCRILSATICWENEDDVRTEAPERKASTTTSVGFDLRAFSYLRCAWAEGKKLPTLHLTELPYVPLGDDSHGLAEPYLFACAAVVCHVPP